MPCDLLLEESLKMGNIIAQNPLSAVIKAKACTHAAKETSRLNI